MTVAIQDNDRGYRELVKRVFGLKTRARIDVGIIDGDRPHGNDGATVLEVGLYNEFGTDRIPARSFIRAWFDENEAKNREDLAKLMQSVVTGARTKEQILELLGARFVGEIQARIAEGIDPPNAKSTIERKGSSTPLIETGVLRSSISFRVVED